MTNIREPPPQTAPDSPGKCGTARNDLGTSQRRVSFFSNLQVTIHPNGKLWLLVHIQPKFGPEFISVRAPQIRITVVYETVNERRDDGWFSME